MRSRGELEQRMDILIRLNAIQLIKGKKQADQIRLLTLAGIGPKEISEIIGTTPNTVNVCLASLRNRNALSLKERDHPDE